MFFTRIAWIAAVVVFAFGALQMLMGLGIAHGMMGPIEAALSRTSAPTTGALIDKGIYKILFAIALGILAEIGSTQRRL